MKLLRRLWNRTAGMFGRDKAEEDLASEIESHIDMQTEDNIRAGMDPQTARREALLKFGSVSGVKESWRDQRVVPFLDRLLLDLRYALRRLVSRPAASLVSVSALACGIGAAAATWSLFSAVLLHPLPVREAERLVVVGKRSVRGQLTLSSIQNGNLYTTYRLIRDNNIFQEFAASSGAVSVLIANGGLPVPGSATFATHDYFETLGVHPAMGRDFTPSDDRRGAPTVAVLSDRYWRREFGAASDVVGRQIRVSNNRVTIVGVAPPGFRGLNLAEAPDLFLPLHTVADVLTTGAGPFTNFFAESTHRNSPLAWLTLTGRLPDGVDATAVLNRLNNLNEGFALTSINTASIPEAAREGTEQFALLLGLTVGLLLLIGCLSVGMLLLIVTEARRPEFAVCIALGASAARLARSVALEGAMLSFGSTLLALPAAYWLFTGLQRFELPGRVQINLLEFSPSGQALAAVAAAAVFASLLIAGVAASFGYSVDVGRAIGSRITASPRLVRNRTRSFLVVGQVAISLVLLAGTGLFARSLIATLNLNPGYDTSRLISGTVALTQYGYTAERAANFFDELRRRLDGNPAIASLSLTSPQGGMGTGGKILIDGVPRQFPSFVSFTGVDAQYFGTMGLPISGRDFSRDDRANAPRVAIVSESLGRVLADGGNPIGHRITDYVQRMGEAPDIIEVVGVVPDIIVDVRRLEPLVLYRPIAQLSPNPNPTLVVRAASDKQQTVRTILDTLKAMDPALAPPSMLSIDDQLLNQMSAQRFGIYILGALGIIAALLTLLGAYVLAETMASARKREMGIRAALGAPGWRLGISVLGETAKLVGFGIMAGIALAWLGASTIQAFLFRVEPLDATTLAVTTTLLLTLAVAVSLRPAILATRVDLARILREE
jgi:predicted permease